MSRWLKNVNALLENLDSQVEETVEEHRFNQTLGAEDGGTSGAVDEQLQEEAKGVDDILARRGLLGKDEEEEEEDNQNYNDEVIVSENDIATVDGGDESGKDVQIDDDANVDVGGGSTGVGVDAKIPAEQQNMPGAGPTDDFDGSEKDSGAVGDVATSGEGGGDDAAFEENNFDGDSNANNDGDEIEQKNDLFGDAEILAQTNKESKAVQSNEEKVPTSGDTARADGGKAGDATAAPSKLKQQAPASSTSSKPKQQTGQSSSTTSAPPAPPKSNNANTSNSNNAASHLKELRKLRRNVLQLNSDLESAEREMEAQRQELDRAASRMERDRSRHKQERESSAASHRAEIAALVSAHERAMLQSKESNEAAVAEMESRISRAEQRRAQEGGERDAELADALERERASVALTARLQEERTTTDERVASLMTEVSRLDTRLEHATSQMELASERERNAEEQLDKALSLHARQLGARQRREVELEQTVADLGGALVVAKNKVEAAMRAGIDLNGGDMFGRSSSSEIIPAEDPLDLKAQLQDSQDEIETLRAQLGLERQRCSTLHNELQDLSKEQADELSGAHAKQRQYERKISDLMTTVAKLQSSLRRMMDSSSSMIGEDALPGANGVDIDPSAAGEETGSSVAGLQYSGDEKKETDQHLRKQIASLSEKIFEQQSRIDHGRAETSTLKNRLRSAALRAETAEKSLEAANQRLIMVESTTSGISSADEEIGLGDVAGRRIKKRRPMGGPLGAGATRKGFRKTSRVESISSALGLHPGRFPSGGWQETTASLLDAFDALAVDLGSHFRHYPVSRLAFMMYLMILHMWAFFLLVYHAHAQGTGTEGHYGPEALFQSYRHMEQAHVVPGVAGAASAAVSAANVTP